MCGATKVLLTIEDTLKKANSEIRRLTDELSKCDREFSKFYHELEQKTFNAVEGYYIAKNFQNLSRRRRIIKQELEAYKVMQRETRKLDLSRIKGAKHALRNTRMRQSKYIADWNIEDLNNDDFKVY